LAGKDLSPYDLSQLSDSAEIEVEALESDLLFVSVLPEDQKSVYSV
jgi:hypothetical protein